MIRTYAELRERRMEKIPGTNHSRWVPIWEVWREMTPGLQAEYLRIYHATAVRQTRRIVQVATRKYRARKGRR